MEVAGDVVVVGGVVKVLQRETLVGQDLERLGYAVDFGVGCEAAECIYRHSAYLHPGE